MPSLTIFDLFMLLCGLAVFLYGMQQGEKNLKQIGGSDLRRLISIITRHRLSAYFAGVITTMVTQSSSATTVILVGLASARLMTLGQSLGMILGSDLGTTFTVSLFAIKFNQFAPLLIATGYFASLSTRHDRVSSYGKLLMAFGFVFFGMSLMAQAVTPLKTNPLFAGWLKASFTNPWLGLLAGTLFTSIIQSSAATLTIIIALAQTYQQSTGWAPGGMELLPLVLGANVGTCATAFISAFRAETEGVRVAWAHFTFKLLGTAAALPFIWLLSRYSLPLEDKPGLQVAILHTAFNLYISVLFLPLLGPFGRLIARTIKHRDTRDLRFHVSYLHQNIESIPVLALSQAIKEIERMSEVVTKMVDDACAIIDHYTMKKAREISELDDEADFLHEQIVTFLTRMARQELGHDQVTRVYELIMVTTDLEHIGDIASKSIINLAGKIEESPIPLSPEGRQEIREFFGETAKLFKEVLAAFTISDKELARSVFERKAASKKLYEQYCNRHMDRLYKGKPESLQTTSIHIDLLEEIQRINHFTFRIAAHILAIHKAE
jgi:phosphate:Na+ symporter